MRVATIDIGTNTVLLLVAERGADGALQSLVERAEITRLGEGVDRSRRLLPAAIGRTKACLGEYARVIQGFDVDRIGVVGTSAMRDASGGEEIRAHVRAMLGVDSRVVSGAEEARLTFRGARSGLSVSDHEPSAVFDLGGGSTEVVMGKVVAGQPNISFTASYDVGSVRLTERCIRHDPPTGEERIVLAQIGAQAFAAVPPLPTEAPPVGVAGTMTTLAAVSRKLSVYQGAEVHGLTMTRAELQRVVDELARVDLESRKRLAGMEPKRADVIVAGGHVALALLDHWGAESVCISDRGVRWGLAEELLQALAAESLQNV